MSFGLWDGAPSIDLLADKKLLSEFNESLLFMKTTVAYGTGTWPGNIHVAPAILWDKSELP